MLKAPFSRPSGRAAQTRRPRGDRLARWRHACAEAADRGSLAWAEFLDWVRLGR